MYLYIYLIYVKIIYIIKRSVLEIVRVMTMVCSSKCICIFILFMLKLFIIIKVIINVLEIVRVMTMVESP